MLTNKAELIYRHEVGVDGKGKPKWKSNSFDINKDITDDNFDKIQKAVIKLLDSENVSIQKMQTTLI